MKKFVIILIAIAVISGAYLLGRSSRTPSEQDQQVAGSHQQAESSHHIHSIIYDSDGNLLLGRHNGLFKSKDGGKNWEKIETKGDIEADDWMSLVIHPNNPNAIYAGGHDLGVIKSEDGGLSWRRADQGIKGRDIHALTISQRNPDILSAYSVDNGVFRSKDGGSSWQRMDDGPENPGVRAFGYMAVQTSMDKSMGWDNWGLLFAGTADGLYQSFSCFCGWTKTSNTFDNTTVYTLATLHKDLRVMYAGTKDGLWKTTDEGKTWKPVEDLQGIKITAVAINSNNLQNLTASSEDGRIYISFDGGSNWEKVE